MELLEGRSRGGGVSCGFGGDFSGGFALGMEVEKRNLVVMERFLEVVGEKKPVQEVVERGWAVLEREVKRLGLVAVETELEEVGSFQVGEPTGGNGGGVDTGGGASGGDGGGVFGTTTGGGGDTSGGGGDASGGGDWKHVAEVIEHVELQRVGAGGGVVVG